MLRLGLSLGRALASDVSWMRLGLLLGALWGQECTGADLGGIEPGPFCGNGVVLPNGKEDS